MSTDKEVTKDLLKTLEDGKNGFAKGAEKLDETNSPELAKSFRRFSEQRAGFEKELNNSRKSTATVCTNRARLRPRSIAAG